jgi:hypothetical protein
VAVVKIGIIAWDCPKPPKVYRQRGNGNGLSSEQIGRYGTISDMVAERSVVKSIVNYDRSIVPMRYMLN